jgi:hypothetical protein
MAPSIKFSVKIFNCVASVFDQRIAAWPYLQLVLTIDAVFLPDRYTGKLFMICANDAEQQLLPLVFIVDASEENAAN